MHRRYAVLMLAVLATACSINKLAVNKLGNALAGSGTTFASDNDPELIAAAVPFSLKLMESLLEASPRHEGLLLATASGFTQYAYAFVQQEADRLEADDIGRATAARDRARAMYIRAREYGLRGLELHYPAIRQGLRTDPRAAVAGMRERDVPMLYWTAAAWGAAIAVSKEVPDLVADLPVVEAMIDRALALDEDYEFGTIHGFLISYEMSRRVSGDATARSRQHFERAVALSNGQMVSPFVAYAEAVSLANQNRAEFDSLLQRALAIDPNARPEWRLANLIFQRRARWLLGRESELFL